MKHFRQELESLKRLPCVEVHLHDHFIEIPFLLAIFKELQQWQGYSAFNYVFLSRQHADDLVQAPLHARTILIYTSNEDGYLPALSQQVGLCFTPDCNQWPLPAGVHMFPLGCNGNIPTVPWREWQERSLDLFFAGQVMPRRGPLLMELIQLLFDLRDSDYQAQVTLSPRFQAGLAPEDYAKTLMNSRLALVPAGVSPITLRLFEALRSGCVPLYQDLPDTWFFKDLPGLCLPLNGSGLSALVMSLLAQPDRLEHLHDQARKHYQAYLTPQAVASYMIQVLSEQLKRL